MAEPFSSPHLLSALVCGGLSFLAAKILAGPFCELLSRGSVAAPNYKGDVIPAAAGIVVPLASFLPLALAGPGEGAALWLFSLFGMGTLGLLDDVAGKGEHGGFSGHIRELGRGRLTTGGAKALFGGAIALYAASALHDGAVASFVAAGLIALSANAVNLLDVRPGRAIKGALVLYAVGLGALAAFGSPFPWAGRNAALACAPLGAGIALLRGDLKARYMIGDSGSNALGFGAGMLLASLPVPAQAAALFVLLGLHALAERRSLTELISKTPALRWLDEIGRR